MTFGKFGVVQLPRMNCVIVHGCPDDSSEEAEKTYAKHWMPWARSRMNKRGIMTEIALMPEPWRPDYEKFKNTFEKYEINEETVLIGHSCGCAFLVRWLGETKQKIKELVLVAPWKIADKKDNWRPKFYEYQIDPTIKSRVEKIVMFTSDNEENEGKQSLKIFHDVLGGKIIDLKNHGHFTIGDMGIEEFPELLAEI